MLLTWRCAESGLTGQNTMGQLQAGQNLWRAPWIALASTCSPKDTLVYIQVRPRDVSAVEVCPLYRLYMWGSSSCCQAKMHDLTRLLKSIYVESVLAGSTHTPVRLLGICDS